MSCRYPGGVCSPEDCGSLCFGAATGSASFPTIVAGIWSIAARSDPDTRGKRVTRKGGFLHDAADFDAEFFGIGPREALAMDPQQRLLLEAAWEAFEEPASIQGRCAAARPGCSRGSWLRLRQ